MAKVGEEGFDVSFIEVFEAFRNIKAIYLNKEQKEKLKARSQAAAADDSDDSEIREVIRNVSYKYSKGAMEDFFWEPRLNYLFNYFAEEIKARGHQISENRGNSKIAPSEEE